MEKRPDKGIASGKARKRTAWILFFYTVPSKPVKNRIKLWRRLARAGAVQLKGAVYVLPYNEEHYEFCQWLMTEVTALGGEGDFVVTDSFEMLSGKDIISLFRSQRESDYNALEKKLNELETKLNNVEKGGRIRNAEKLKADIYRSAKEYADIQDIDFFPFRASLAVGRRISALQKKISGVLGTSVISEKGDKKAVIPRRNSADYKKIVWITRKNPFVDRMASAWLIRKFIDSEASFRFIDEHDQADVEKGSVTFDMKNGDITHIKDSCTFEVLVKSFGIKDKAVKKIAELVHELDIKDDKFRTQEAKGIGEVLMGIRKTGRDDNDILEKGMAVFEMFYASRVYS